MTLVVNLAPRAYILNQACEYGMSAMPHRPFDLYITSPPYNVGQRYDGYEDRRTREKYISWMEEVAGLCYDKGADNAMCFLNVAGRPGDQMLPVETIQAWEDSGWHVQNMIHWIKSAAMPSSEDGVSYTIGHYKPVNSERYLYVGHEYVAHLTKNGNTPIDKLAVGVPYADKTNLSRDTRGKNGDIHDRGNVWFIPHETRVGKPEYGHPCSFPEKLVETCLYLSGIFKRVGQRPRPRPVVCDPFAGVGTVALCAAANGLDSISYEVSETYCDTAERRVRKDLGVKGVRVYRHYGCACESCDEVDRKAKASIQATISEFRRETKAARLAAERAAEQTGWSDAEY